jgi:hypothetical protein
VTMVTKVGIDNYLCTRQLNCLYTSLYLPILTQRLYDLRSRRSSSREQSTSPKSYFWVRSNSWPESVKNSSPSVAARSLENGTDITE